MKAGSQAQVTQGAQDWALLRTNDPHGGKQIVSVMRAGKVMESDADFAGLILRCGGTDPDVLLVVTAPLSPDPAQQWS